jgi:uncharacterized protein (TIGR00645 family)
VLFLALAILGLVVKSIGYVISIFEGIFSESAGTLIYHALALVDITLVIGLLSLIIGHVVHTYALVGNEEEESMPEWLRQRISADDDYAIKVKIAITVLLIATIDLLGIFIAISVMPKDQFAELLVTRVWYMLALHGALVVTAVVLILFARTNADPSSRAERPADGE